jgi:AcrR family transcriptional regulator
MPTSRRTPVQRRAVERVARITRAAGELCALEGAAAVTMEAIAARAGTSIGSVYQFFPNRDALLQAVAEGYVADLVAVLEAGDAPDVARLPLPALVDAVLAPFDRFHETHPGYFAILFAPAGSAALGALRGRLRARLQRRAEAIFRARAPGLAPARRRRLALTAVEAARALVQYIETGVPAAERRAMRLELRAMLVAYLAPALGDGAGDGGDGATDPGGGDGNGDGGRPAGVA